MGKDISGELEEEERKLEEEIKKREKDAGERLDQLLPENRMEFCSRCGRRIKSIEDYAGKCSVEGCDRLICNDCWQDPASRYCREHADKAPKKPEEVPEDLTKEKIKNLTLNYQTLIEERFEEKPIDWTSRDFFPGARSEIRKREYGEFALVVYTKRLVFFKKKRIELRIFPLDYLSSLEMDVNEMMDRMNSGIQNIAVFVSDSGSLSDHIIDFFGKFSNNFLSMYLLDFENKGIYFNTEDKKTRNYSFWVDPNRKPKGFVDLLKSFSEEMSGRMVISAKSFSKGFGITEEEANKFLDGCKFLSNVRDTDSYIFKKD